jgi:hypothetical protein
VIDDVWREHKKKASSKQTAAAVTMDVTAL